MPDESASTPAAVEPPAGDRLSHLDIRLPGSRRIAAPLLLPPGPRVESTDDGAVLFRLEEGEVAYLTTKENRNFQEPPESDPFHLAGRTSYTLDASLRMEGVGEAELWLIEYDDRNRLAHWRSPLTASGLKRTWETSPGIRRSCLAIRLRGSGRLDLGPVRIDPPPEAAGDETATPEPPRFDLATQDFDLELFVELNREYASKPLVPKPRSYTRSAVVSAGEIRARQLRERFNLAGKRVLEVGCGRGEVLHALAGALDVEALGVDVNRYELWDEFAGPSLSFERLDVTAESYSHLGRFDFVFSIAVWEHIHHPHGALAAVHDLLGPGGRAYIVANLHRGPRASHRYREIYFPWPHLLFRPAVFRQYYESLGRPPAGPAWVNRLTAAHYLLYFDLLGFEAEEVWYKVTPIDEAFYRRFEHLLGQYPRFDLERDFIHAVLRKPT